MNQLPYQFDTGFGLVEPFQPLQQQETDYCEFSGEEDDMSERDLAENAQWKKIQQNTFTRWANEHLKLVSAFICDLERDLSDGLLLIALVEVLARKKLPKYNKKPSFRSQKLENVSLVLKFLQEDEGIKIVNIDSTHIVDCKLKLILGLIWTLILHYSISMPLWEGEDLNNSGSDSTPKQRLMNWIKTRLPPEVPVRNFTTDWNDGKAIGALVDSVAPGLCPDWEDWDSRNNLRNATEAIDLANKWLDVPQLIQPEEMVNPNVDEQSVMTYLSQFPNAKVKPGAPLRPKNSINKIRVYGKGVDSKSLPAGQETKFFIESSYPLLHERLDVLIESSRNQRVPVNITPTNNEHTHFTVTYNPKIEGNYKVNVTVNGQHVPKSPFNLHAEAEAPTVAVFGPGLQSEGVPVNEVSYFEVTLKNTNDECKPPKIIITDPDGNENVIPMKTYSLGPNYWRCEYVPKNTGPHSINLFMADKPTPIFHTKVNAVSLFDVKKVKASGRGLQPKGVRVQDIADFKIYTGGTEPEAPEIQILGPGKDTVPHKVLKKDGVYQVEYQPVKEGRHVIIIKIAGQEIHKSPFEVDVGPFKKTVIEAYGPGLTGGIVNYPALFTVETNGETGALGFSIQGPSQAKIECHDNGDGSADVRYYPTAPGEYAIHILCNNEDIPRSPYISEISPKVDYHPENVDVYGPGVETNNVKERVPNSFTVDTRKAGTANLEANVRDGNGDNVPIEVIKKSDGLYEYFYIPTNSTNHTVHVNYGGVAVKNSPYRVNVKPSLDVSKIYCYGPGTKEDVKANTPSQFTVDVRDAGDADLTAHLINTDRNEEVPLKLTNNGDGTYTVQYKPVHVGSHSLSLCYGGVEVPGSPKFKVIPNIDVTQIKVEGLESRVYVGAPTDLLLDTQDSTLFNSDQVICKITNPSGTQTKNIVTNLPDGTYKISFTPFEEGRHTIDIFYDNIPVPGSPFTVNVKRGSDAKKCSAHGPGLEKGVLNKPNHFTIETKGAGTGGLSLEIEGPAEAKMTYKDNRDGSCDVEYLPTEAGEYEITVRFDDKPIPGSPFKVMVESDGDEGLVKAFGPGLDTKKSRSGVPAHFTVDLSKAKPAPVAVQISSDSKPVIQSEINDNGDGTFDVSYVPPNEGANLRIKVLYDEKDIPGSPFPITVQPSVEPEKVKMYGKTLQDGRTPASLPTDIQIDTSEAGKGDLDIKIVGPDGNLRPVTLKDKGNGVYKASFTPDDCGQYKLYSKYGGKEITKIPVAIQAHPVGQATGCEITRQMQEPSIGETNCIRIDTKNCGNGAVTCKIKSHDGKDIDVKTVDNGDGTISIYFSIMEAGEYTVNIKYGGQTIPGGTYKFMAKEYKTSEKVNSYESYENHVHETRETRTMEYKDSQHQDLRGIHLNNIPLLTTGGHVTAEIKMPSGKIDKPVIEDNHDGTVSIKYDPREEGVHELAVKFNGEHIQGSPYKIHVDSISSGYVTAYGPGLTHGVSGEPSNFTISTKGAGAGGLSMAVEGPSKAEINCHDNKDGTVSVSYLPTAPGEYKITIRFGDKHIKGSPFLAKITGEGRKRNQISVGSCSEVSLPGKISDSDIRSLNASIQAPSGLEEPCFLKRLPTGNIGISFTPREVGEHVVSVKRMGNHITNSPFKINVCEREVGDAKKVKVTGNGLKEGKTHTDNSFTVDTRNSGFGGLSLSIEGPSKAEIQCNDNSDGTLKISYKPTEPGYYIVNLKFADHHVDGSPFTVKVVGEGSNRQREKIQRQREAVPITEVGSQCKLTFKMPGITSFDLSSTVTSPGGVTEDAEINEVKDGLYAVHFVPKELGIHTVSVKYKEIHIPGSPFQFTVGPYRDHGAHLVKAGGVGLERGEQGEINEFNVWTREAGSGQLAISVEGPSKAEINFADRKDGSCDVSYKVSEPGEYRIGLKFNDEHIPDSPFKVYISPAVGDAHLLEVAQFPEGSIQADKPSQFIVRRNGAKGDLDAKIVGPSGNEDDCFVQIIDMEEYSVRFMPRENGVHKIHCKFNGVHIPGSPFSVKVGKDTADPAAVHAHGNGLTQVKTGVKTDFIVDTVNAGMGTLAVSVDGPSKVSMDCTEVEEGYKVRYTPLAPGDYYISIKYNNHHIVGSPFKVNSKGDRKQVADIGGQETSSVVVETVSKVAKNNHKGPVMPTFKSDASKVEAKGMGLKKAYIGKQNQFSVSANNAGANILFVGIHGPKGPCEEVFIKHQGHNQYAVNYIVRDRGDYLVIVKWGEDQIPGSPFKVEV